MKPEPSRVSGAPLNLALVRCADCGRELSPRALGCPHCGAPGPGRTAGGSHRPPHVAPRFTRTRTARSGLATTVVAATTGAAAASIAYLLFALFAADIYLGHSQPGNLWEVLGLAVATALPIEGALRGWRALRRRRPAGHTPAAEVIASLALCLCVLGLGLGVCVVGFTSAVDYIEARGDLGWTLILGAATVLLVFAPWWLWWAICRRATWVERVYVTAIMSLLGYGALRLLWMGIETLAAQRGVAHGALTARLGAFICVAALCVHAPGWVLRRTRRHLDELEQRDPA